MLFKKKYFTTVMILCLWLAGSACDGLGGNNSLEQVIISEIDQKEMVLIPAGEFIMGTNKTDTENTHQQIGTVKPLYLDQQPERKINLPAYYIDRYEVTNKEYKRFIDATQFDELPSHWENETYPEELADHPVTNITWREAWSYAMWAHKQLPTEEQWEKAARGTGGQVYPWGDVFEKGNANMGIEGARKTVPIGSYLNDVSPFQVYDMGGNVMEWTQDWYQAYPGSDYKDPRFGKTFKVLRGNGFQQAGHYFLEAYRYSFYRTEAEPNEYFSNVGFRCATPFIKE